MADDHRRAERLRQNPRPDVALGGRVQRFVEALQGHICQTFERIDGAASFGADRWERPGGGGGLTRVIGGGEVWEKGGVSTSAVHGHLPAPMAERLGIGEGAFFATGLSLVMHPRNPYVPAVHANFRYFALGDDPAAPADQWFGGGADLTPTYPERADAEHFHGVWKRVCDEHAVADYRTFKRQCDAYFFLPHRDETRGVGGIFFDHLRDDPEGAFLFVRQAARAFLSSYVPIVERRKDQPWGERERDFQTLRRGRYAEFNLAFDRGTRFGLETGGRTESVLMSLPPVVRWDYDRHAAPGTPEAEALAFFRPHDWLGVEGKSEDPARS